MSCGDKDPSSRRKIAKPHSGYPKPGRMPRRLGILVSYPNSRKDFAQLSKTKLTMPVLG